MNSVAETRVALSLPLRRGERRLRIALVGLPNSGKSTLFRAVSSVSVQRGELQGTGRAYEECKVQVGLDEASLVHLPSIRSLSHLPAEDRVTLQYLLWGNELPPISAHETGGPPAPFAPPDVIVQVVDATALERHLELTLELIQLGRPMVIALNMMDEAWQKGLHISTRTLARELGVPVVPMVAIQGKGVSELFAAAVAAVRAQSCPVPQPLSEHIARSLESLARALSARELYDAFRVPHALLLAQVAAGDPYFSEELRQHFPERLASLESLRAAAGAMLPRSIGEELHADRHHRAATLFERVTRVGAPHEGRGWRYWLDELFLNPHWGFVGSLAVFAVVLFMVFEVSAWLDGLTAARLIEAVSDWQPQSTTGVIARAVTDGLIGLIGIVVPYMVPLVLLLVVLEQAGVMPRIAFVVDRWFHHIGLHGGVAVPFLLGLGCNVPAISAAARAATGRERVVASILITFVPCSARSAVILALAGKYLGGLGVFAIFMLTIVVLAVIGHTLARRFRVSGPGQVQEIPPFTLPIGRAVLASTWERTRDIVTIVTPLLVAGSVLLALLNHFGADRIINALFTPVTSWWLGLPIVLGVPILFGVLRKELSLLMIYQALGSFDVGAYLDWVQIVTFLLFLTFYIPCVSTFAVMLRTIGRRAAAQSIALSVGVALLVSGLIRLPLEAVSLVLD